MNYSLIKHLSTHINHSPKAIPVAQYTRGGQSHPLKSPRMELRVWSVWTWSFGSSSASSWTPELPQPPCHLHTKGRAGIHAGCLSRALQLPCFNSDRKRKKRAKKRLRIRHTVVFGELYVHSCMHSVHKVSRHTQSMCTSMLNQCFWVLWFWHSSTFAEYVMEHVKWAWSAAALQHWGPFTYFPGGQKLQLCCLHKHSHTWNPSLTCPAHAHTHYSHSPQWPSLVKLVVATLMNYDLDIKWPQCVLTNRR